MPETIADIKGFFELFRAALALVAVLAVIGGPLVAVIFEARRKTYGGGR
jgi:hypothetical protein